MNESYHNDPRITDYVLDAMSGEQRQAFEQELAADPRLAQEVQLAAQVTDQLQAMYAAEATGELSPQRREAILASSPADTATPAAPIAATDERSWLSIAAMVIPMLAVIAVLLYSARQAPQQVAEGTAQLKKQVEQLTAENIQLETRKREIEQSLADEKVARRDSERQLGGSLPAESPPGASAAPPTKGRELAGDPVTPPTPTAPAPTTGPQSSPADSYAMGATPLDLSKSNDGLQSLGRASSPTSAPPSNQPVTLFSRNYGLESRGTVARDTQSSASLGWRSQNLRWEDAGRAGVVATDESGMGMGMGLATSNEEMRRMGGMAMGMGMDMGGMGMGMGGMGPGMGGDQFEPITDNPFQRADEHPLSTFSIDVDTASYSKVRSYLQQNSLPRPDAVRIEELINYFDYQYSGPGNPPSEDGEQTDGERSDDDPSDDAAPFKADVEIAGCPWTPEHRLVRVGIKGREIENQDRPASNLVFLLDVSGSMNSPNKLPLVKRGMQMLLDQLGENDRVAIVVYASATGLVLDSTPADQHAKIFDALERLSAGGSTNGGDGIRLAYSVARDNFIAGGVNRVLLCTDGDFNVGTTGTDELVRLVEQESKGGIFVSVLGFGMGNHNDSMLEQISNKGNGNYAFIDTAAEAHKVFVKQTNGTLVTIAKDVKIQVEFNPQEVAAYRLIGYENRILAKEDFNDDTVDAGEIGAGHTVTALYEVVPGGQQPEPIAPAVDELRYQKGPRMTKQADSGELLTLKLRYKLPDGDTSTLMQFPVRDAQHSFGDASEDFQFASAVAGFGMQLRHSPYKGQWTLAAVTETAESAVGEDTHGLRTEFVELVKKAAALTGQTQP